MLGGEKEERRSREIGRCEEALTLRIVPLGLGDRIRFHNDFESRGTAKPKTTSTPSNQRPRHQQPPQVRRAYTEYTSEPDTYAQPTQTRRSETPPTCLTNLSGIRAHAPTEREQENGTFRKEKGHLGERICGWKKSGLTSRQPRLHPQGRSHPQVRPEHLPSVL